MSVKWPNEPRDKTYGFKASQYDPDDNGYYNRFHSLYFIDSQTGSVLVSNKYSNFSETNDDLISGFLSAMNMFIQEIKSDTSEEIQEINFQGSRILYERKGRLLCIGISKKTDLTVERTMLKQIASDFYFRFRNHINNFNGFIEPEIADYKIKLQQFRIDPINSKEIRIV